jgi:alkylated DNA repair dioxygenase AlkB
MSELIFMDRTPSLFPPTLGGPSGLRYEPDFVSPAEEQELIGQVQRLPLQPFQFGAYEGKRRVASFGWRYDYTQHRLEAAAALPSWILPLIARIEAFTGCAPIRQVLCTEYDQGVGIGWHRDKPHFDEVFGLSLASQCRLRFRRQNGAKWQRFTLEAQPRSLYMMTGAARQTWEHSIPPVAAPRFSITFRTMRQSEA